MHKIPPLECETDLIPEFSVELAATGSNLVRVLGMIDDYAIERNLDRGIAIRLRIIVEELFTNTIKYGYGGDSTGPVRLSLRFGERWQLTYEDAAPPFDPLEWHARWRLDSSERDDVVGQRGIPLILGLGHQIRYQCLDAGNRLVLTIGG